MDKNKISSRAIDLQRFWGPRDTKMRDWYEQIELVDLLEERDMESFVGNDPRSSLNLIRGILLQKIPHRLPYDRLDPEHVLPATELSRMFAIIWENIMDDYRESGRKWMRDFINFMLSTGWTAVAANMSLDGSKCIAEVLNPITVYPSWTNKLAEVAHIWVPTEQELAGLNIRNGWGLDGAEINAHTKIIDYWHLEQSYGGVVVYNEIQVGGKEVKPDTPELRFDRIPIFVMPVGGLPDRGSLTKSRNGNSWKEEVGQSFIATNESVYKASNKWWSLMMQLLRDTAQARTYEKSASPQQIVRPETWYRHGAHYKLGLQDEIGFIAPPALPPELRSTQLDLEAMMQRGGPSWTMFGTVNQGMTAYAMAQVAATTNHIAKDFHEATVDSISDIDNFFYNLIRNNNYKPYGMSLPKGLPPGIKISAEYELRIPGDIVQRATTARMLNPEFELSDERVYDELFPEIKNPAEELAAIRANNARKDPLYAALALIDSLREESKLLSDAGDNQGAALYKAAADIKERQIMGAAEQQQEQQPQFGNMTPYSTQRTPQPTRTEQTQRNEPPEGGISA